MFEITSISKNQTTVVLAMLNYKNKTTFLRRMHVIRLVEYRANLRIQEGVTHCCSDAQHTRVWGKGGGVGSGGDPQTLSIAPRYS